MTLKNDINALFQQALAHQDGGRLVEAVALYDQIAGAAPHNAVVFYNRGLALQGLNRLEAAVASYQQAITFHPNYAEAHSNCGDALQALGKLAEAVVSYDRAIAANSNIAEIYSNRGGALHKLGKFAAAVADYDRAIAMAPSPEAHANRGLALLELGRTDDALADFKKVDERSPAYVDARLNTFALHLSELRNMSLIEETGAEAARIHIKRACDDLSRRKEIADFHALHEFEQASYLIEHGHHAPELLRLRDRLKTIYERRGSNNSIALTDNEIAEINHYRAEGTRYRVVREVGACLNPDNDWLTLEEKYLSVHPEIIFIDNFLSPDTLEALQSFCLASNIWHKAYDGQYLGAFAQDGFISPLHCQIARELSAKMPRIFGEHALRQLWSFKCMSSKHRGLKVHADFARVNLNFWLTPDDANLDPASGGMIVHDAAPPLDWNFRDYNSDGKDVEDRIYEFLRERSANKIKIPYRCNRAVLFNSSLFHETDQFHFKDGYENRRINVTYLFGKGLKTP